MSGTNGDTLSDSSKPVVEKIEVSLLEKRLEGMRDTQESVQGLSLWCQANKRHSTAIIDTWLKVLRKSPIEKRLTMFYLANDVVQHAKRRGDSTVLNQWVVAVQKATPHVRSPSSVSTAIIRIFKIWEERLVYSKDTVADLVALINNVPGREKLAELKKDPELYTAVDEKVKGFQSSSLISKVKLAYRLKSHLGVTFRTKHYVNMNMQQLIESIKDRQHGMSVVEDMSSLMEQCRASENKLQHEVDERRRIAEAAEIAIVYYENVRSEARIVNTAYKNFTERVVKCKEKVDEQMRAFDEMEGIAPRHDDEEIQIILPPLSETIKAIEVVQSNARAQQALANANNSYESQSSSVSNNSSAPYNPHTPVPVNNVQPAGMFDPLAWTHSEAYTSMLSSLMQMHQQQQQQPNNYPVPGSMPQMYQQQQVTQMQNYGYQAGDPNLVPQQQPGMNDIGSIPLPPPPAIPNVGAPPMTSNPPLPPVPHDPTHSNMGPPPPANQGQSQYDHSAQSHIPSLMSQEYDFSQDYDPGNSKNYDDPMQGNYDPGPGPSQSNNISVVQPEAQYSPTQPSRYHPYNNTTPQRQYSGGNGMPRTRGQGPRNPRPILSPPTGYQPRQPRFNPRTPTSPPPRGGNRFQSFPPPRPSIDAGSPPPMNYNESPSQPRNNVEANLLRIAGGMTDSHPHTTGSGPVMELPSPPPAYGYSSNPYFNKGEPEGLNGSGDIEAYSPRKPHFEKPYPPGPGVSRGSIRPRALMSNGPRPRMPMRGRGDRGGFNRGPATPRGGFRGGAGTSGGGLGRGGMRGGGPRRGGGGW